MADQREEIILTAKNDTDSAVKAANRGIESVEKTAERAAESVTSSTRRQAEAIVTVTSSSQKRIDQMLNRLRQRTAALESPTDRLFAQRQAALRTAAGDPEAIKVVNQEFAKLIQYQRDLEASDKRSRREREVNSLLSEQKRIIDSLRTAEERRDASRKQALFRARDPLIRQELQKGFAEEDRLRAQHQAKIDQQRTAELQRQQAQLRQSVLSRVQSEAATPMQQLLTKRAADIGALAGEAAAVSAVTAAYEKLILVQKQRDALNIAQKLGAFSRVMTLGVTLPLLAAGAASIKAEQDFRKSDIALTQMMGSAGDAKKLLGELKQFAFESPFEFKDLVPQAQRLKALGFEAKNLIPIMRAVGEATAGVGGNKETFDRITLALGQMQSKERVMAQEMNQLTEALIPAWDILAKKLGIDVRDAMKKVEDGAVSAAVAVPAILKGMADKFAGTMALQNQEILGQLSNLRDKVWFLLADEEHGVGAALKPAATQFLKFGFQLVEWVQKLVDLFLKLPEPVKNVTIALLGLLTVLGPIAKAAELAYRALALMYGLEGAGGLGKLLRALWLIPAALINIRAQATGTAVVLTAFETRLAALPAILGGLATRFVAVWGPIIAMLLLANKLIQEWNEKSKDVEDQSGHRMSAGGDAMRRRFDEATKKPELPVMEQVRLLREELKKYTDIEMPQGSQTATQWRDQLKGVVEMYRGIEAYRKAAEEAMGKLGLSDSDKKKIAEQELRARQMLLEAQAQQLDPIQRIRKETERTKEELAKQIPLTKQATADLNEREAILIAAERLRSRLAGEAEQRQSQIQLAGVQLANQHQAALAALESRRAESFPDQAQIEQERADIEMKFARDRMRNEQDMLRAHAASALADTRLTEEDRANIQRKYVADWIELQTKGTAEVEAARTASGNRILQLERQHEQEIIRMRMDSIRQTIEMEQAPIDAQKRVADAQLALQAVGAVTVQEKIALENQKLAIEEDYARRTAEIQLRVLQHQRTVDLALAQNDFEKRLAILERYHIDEAKLAQDTDARIQESRIESAQRTAEVIQQVNQDTFNRFRDGFDRTLTALFRKGQSFGQAFGSMIRAAFLSALKDIAANQFARLMTQITTGTQVTLKSPARGSIFGGILGQIGLGSVPVFGGNRRPWDEKIPIGADGTMKLKIDQPNRLADLQLVSGAVPVVIQGAGPELQRQAQQASTSESSSLPALLGGIGLGSLVTAGGSGGKAGTAVQSSIGYEGGGGMQTVGAAAVTPGTAGAAGGGIFSKLGSLGQLAQLGGGFKNILTTLGNLGPKGGYSAAGKWIPTVKGVGGVTGGAMLLGGGALLATGLYQGGVKGVFMDIAGGALVGAKFGGPVGALIGAAAGGIAGLIRLGIKSKAEKIQDKVRALYGISIDKKFAQELAKRIDQNYGGNIDVGIRSPEIRDLLQLYAQSRLTPEEAAKFPLAYKPYGVGVQLAGGQLQQTAAMMNGTAIAYGGGSLGISGPVDKLITGETPSQHVGDLKAGYGQPAQLIVQNLSLSVNGESATAALTGAVAKNPEVVGQASIAANDQRVGGRATQIALTPGLVTG